MPTTGQLIRQARVAAAESQVRLALALRLPGGNLRISALETEKDVPNPEEVAALLEHFGLPSGALDGDGIPDLPSTGMVRRGRPERRKYRNSRSPVNILGPIPEWIGYEDLKKLIRQYRGHMYDERKFRVWVEVGHPTFGKVPSRIDRLTQTTGPFGVRRRAYHWEDVRRWIESTLGIPD